MNITLATPFTPIMNVSLSGMVTISSPTGFTTTGLLPYWIRNAFLDFALAELVGKCLMFKECDEAEPKIVNKIEAVKYAEGIFYEKYDKHTLSSFKDLRFFDDEWDVYFKKAMSIKELDEMLDSSMFYR